MERISPTNRELVEAVLEYRNLEKKSGELGGLDPLAPLLLLDMEYHIFNGSVRKFKCAHSMRHHKNEWKRNYDLFDKEEFQPFREGSPYRNRIIDLMDDLEQWLEKPLRNLRKNLWDFFPEFDDNERHILVEALICNTLIRIASSYWRTVFHTPSGECQTNARIQAMAVHSIGFIDDFMNSTKTRCGRKNLNTSKDVTDATHAIDTAVDDWIYNHNDKQE